MRRTVVLLAAVAASAAMGSGPAESPVERITGAALARGGAMAFLERLTDGIGGRTGLASSYQLLTGSD